MVSEQQYTAISLFLQFQYSFTGFSDNQSKDSMTSFSKENGERYTWEWEQRLNLKFDIMSGTS